MTGEAFHEPAGFLRVTERAFSASFEDGWLVGGDVSSYAGALEPTATGSPPGVARITFPAGSAGGASPVVLERWFAGSAEVYLRFTMRLSPAWQGHSAYDAVVNVWMDGVPRFFWGFRGAGSASLQPLALIQDTPTPPDGARWLESNLSPTADLQRGEWHVVEIVLRADEYHCWLDGAKIAEHTDVLFSEREDARWQIVHWEPIWGGGGDSLQAEQSIEVDHLRLSAGGLWPGEPAGFAPLSDQPFNGLVDAGWNIVFNASGYVRTVTDFGGPMSPGSAIEFRYPEGFQGGEAPGTEYFDFWQGAGRVFVGLWWKANAEWQGHPSNGNKIQFLRTNALGSMFMAFYGPPGGPYDLRVFPQFSTSLDQWLVPNVENVPVRLGEWHRIEWLVEYEPADPAPRGRVRWWLDGRLLGDHGDVPFPRAALVQHQLSPTWGGVGGVKARTDHMWFDHAYVSAP